VGGGLRETDVVVIEADDLLSWAITRILRTAGLNVEVFASVEQFIRSDQVPFTACLVVDVQMPGMSGLQLQSHLASTGRHIPIVFITTSADERVQAIGSKMGAVDFQVQPSGEKALLKEIGLRLKPKGKQEPTGFCIPEP
jgi:FixJ family two-component response regulator